MAERGGGRTRKIKRHGATLKRGIIGMSRKRGNKSSLKNVYNILLKPKGSSMNMEKSPCAVLEQMNIFLDHALKRYSRGNLSREEEDAVSMFFLKFATAANSHFEENPHFELLDKKRFQKLMDEDLIYTDIVKYIEVLIMFIQYLIKKVKGVQDEISDEAIEYQYFVNSFIDIIDTNMKEDKAKTVAAKAALPKALEDDLADLFKGLSVATKSSPIRDAAMNDFAEMFKRMGV